MKEEKLNIAEAGFRIRISDIIEVYEAMTGLFVKEIKRPVTAEKTKCGSLYGIDLVIVCTTREKEYERADKIAFNKKRKNKT